MNTKTLSFFVLALALTINACTPVAVTSSAEEPTTTMEAQPTVNVEIPATSTDQARVSTPQCDFTLSTPPGMYLAEETPYSEIYRVFLEKPEEGAQNFVYVSIVTPEIQNKVKAGTYQSEVYNYDPKVTETLLGMVVGESKSVSGLDTGFTYERKPDTQISGYTAQAFVNLQPWEFPLGIKEIRYYLSANGCMYIIGGYVDTIEAHQPGAIVEKLFNEIVATIQVLP